MTTHYDIVVDIPSIVSGGNPMSGWPVAIRPEKLDSVVKIASSALSRPHTTLVCEDGSEWLPLNRNEANDISNTVAPISKSCCLLSVVGMFNRGKTYILNQLGDLSFPAGLTESTKGISARVESEGSIVFIDSAGNSSPIDDALIRETREELRMKFDAEFHKNSSAAPHPGDEADQSEINNWKDSERKRKHALGTFLMNRCLITKQCTERFQEDVVFATSDVLLFVTNGLTYPDQILLAGIQAKASDAKCPLIVVHNFRDCSDAAEFKRLKKAVSTVTGHDLISEYMGDGETIEMIQFEKVIHLFLGQAGTPAGQQNSTTFMKIKNMIDVYKTFKPQIDSFLSFIQDRFWANLHPHIRGTVEGVILYANKHVLNNPTDAKPDNILRMRISTKLDPSANPRLREDLSAEQLQKATRHLWLNKDIVGLDGSQLVFARADFSPKIDSMFLDLNKGQGAQDLVYKIIVELPGFVSTGATTEGYKDNNVIRLEKGNGDPSILVIAGKRSKLHRTCTRVNGAITPADLSFELYSPASTDKGEHQSGTFERKIQIPAQYDLDRRNWKMSIAHGILEIIIPKRKAV